MLSGGDGREVPSSSASYPPWKYGGTFSPTEASPAPWPQQQQTVLTKSHLYVDFSSREDNSRRNLSHNNAVGELFKKSPLLVQLLVTGSNKNNDAFLLSQQSKSTLRPTTCSPTVSLTMPKENKNLNDDQILKIIEEKLTCFRAQMKARNSGLSWNSSNTKQHPIIGPSTQRALDDHISKDHREAKASGSTMRNAEQSRVKDNGTAEYVRIMQETAAVISKEKEDGRVLQTPGSLTTVEDLTNHRPTVALHHKPFAEDSRVLQTPGSLTTVQDLTNHRPTVALHHKLFDQTNNSTLRNIYPYPHLDKEGDLHSVRNEMKAVKDVPSIPNVVDVSKLNQATRTYSALETTERESLTKTSTENLPQLSDQKNVRMHSSQTSSLSMDIATKCTPSGGHIRGWNQQYIEEMEEDQIKTGDEKMEIGLFDRVLEGQGVRYEDISDDEEANRTQQISTHKLSSQSKNIHENHPSQFSRHMANVMPAETVDINSSTSQFQQVSVGLDHFRNDEGPVLENGAIHAGISSKLPKQSSLFKENSSMEHPEVCSSDWKLQCSCPFFVENDDGFEQRPCPKCTLDRASQSWKDDSSPKWEEESLPKRKRDTLPNRKEDFSHIQDSGFDDSLNTDCFDSQNQIVTDIQCEEDEWFVVPLTISDVKLDQKIVVLDDTDDEESGYPLNFEPQNQPIQSVFQKLPEFDSLPSFLYSKSLQFNFEVPMEVTNTIPSVQLPLASGSLPTTGAVEKSPSVPSSTLSTEAEDSCDTDDSSDYPLQTKRNYLTAPIRVEAPSPMRRVSESVEEGEVAQAPDTMPPVSPVPASSSISPPVLSTDEDEELTTFASSQKKKYCNDASKTKIKRNCKSKTSKRHFVSCDDNDFEFDQNRNLKYTRSDGSKLGKVSSQPKQSRRTRSIQARVEQNDEALSSVSSKVSSHSHHGQAAKRKSTSKKSSSNHVRKVRACSEATEGKGKKILENNRSVRKTTGLKESSKSDILNCKANNPNAKPKTSETARENFVKRKMLECHGERYQIYSPPGFKQTEPPKLNRVNSYSTAKSTQAKQRLVQQWESQDFPPLAKRRRRRSNEQGATSPNKVNVPNRRDQENSARQKRNSKKTPLVMKTLCDAALLTQQTHRQAPTEQNRGNKYIATGYKWTEPVPKVSDLERERDKLSPQHPRGLKEF